ncbi:MAG: hypothetical protein HQK54_03535 [Oligoflexales bacterium]|nr:hypothetical protein [Oligoflexales bacterium]
MEDDNGNGRLIDLDKEDDDESAILPLNIPDKLGIKPGIFLDRGEKDNQHNLFQEMKISPQEIKKQDEVKAAQVQETEYLSPRYRKRKIVFRIKDVIWILGFIVVLVIGFEFVKGEDPFFITVRERIGTYYHRLSGKLSFWRKKEDVNRQVKKHTAVNGSGDKTMAKAETSEVGSSCDKVIPEMESNKRKGIKDLVLVNRAVHCYLVVQDLKNADSLSSSYFVYMNKDRKNWDEEDIYSIILRQKIDVGLWREKKARTESYAACDRWQKTIECVGRLYLTGLLGISVGGEEGFNILKEGIGSSSKKLRALIWLSGARIASKEGDFDAAALRFSNTMELLKEERNGPLYFEVLRSQMINAYRKNDPGLGSLVLNKIREQKFGGQEISLRQMFLLKALLTSSPTATFQNFFSNEKTRNKQETNPEFFEIISFESNRLGLGEQYLAYLKNVRAQLRSNDNYVSEIKNKLDQWEIRSYLSLGQFGIMNVKLSEYAGNYGNDIFVIHFRGINLFKTSVDKKYRLEALKEFEKATILSLNWQSLFAQATVASMLNDKIKFRKAYQTLMKFKLKSLLERWKGFLEIESLLLDKKRDEALVKLEKIMKKYPYSAYGKEMRFRIMQLKNMKYTSKPLNKTDRYANVSREHDVWEEKANPFGPFALLY